MFIEVAPNLALFCTPTWQQYLEIGFGGIFIAKFWYRKNPRIDPLQRSFHLLLYTILIFLLVFGVFWRTCVCVCVCTCAYWFVHRKNYAQRRLPDANRTFTQTHTHTNQSFFLCGFSYLAETVWLTLTSIQQMIFHRYLWSHRWNVGNNYYYIEITKPISANLFEFRVFFLLLLSSVNWKMNIGCLWTQSMEILSFD